MSEWPRNHVKHWGLVGSLMPRGPHWHSSSCLDSPAAQYCISMPQIGGKGPLVRTAERKGRAKEENFWRWGRVERPMM
jgi:hypothetical protein